MTRLLRRRPQRLEGSTGRRRGGRPSTTAPARTPRRPAAAAAVAAGAACRVRADARRAPGRHSATRRPQASEPPSLIAAHNLPAGTVVTAADLRQLPAGARTSVVLGRARSSAQEATVIGQRLTVPVSSGDPLDRSVLAAASAAPPAFTLALPAPHALGGQLQPRQPGHRASRPSRAQRAARPLE